MTQTTFDYEFVQSLVDLVYDETDGTISGNAEFKEGNVILQVVDTGEGKVTTYMFKDDEEVYKGMQELYDRQMELYPSEEFLNSFAALLGALKDYAIIETDLP